MKKITLIILAAFFANLSFAQNPEFERTTNLNSGWKFQPGEVHGFMTPAFNDQSWRMLQLPHDWAIEGKYAESNPAGESGGYLANGIGYYRKSFQIPETMKGKRISIRFDGVYMNSTVYINGIYLGNRPYGFSSFGYDLTPYLKYKEGTLKAVAYNHSEKVAEHILKTADKPNHLMLLAEKETVDLSKEELIYITVEVSDKNGVRCPNTNNNINVKIEGGAELIGIDSGNQFSHEQYKTSNRDAFEGRILVTVKPTKSGIVKVEAFSENLNTGTKSVTVN